MSRLLARALLTAVVAGVALTNLENEQELLAWELLLVLILLWDMRGMPRVLADDHPPLFDPSPAESRRLPRSLSSTELDVIDALSGYLGPERRLQPLLKGIAVHRLQLQGVSFESPAAVRALGEEEWSWLANPTNETPSPETLEAVVSSVEGL
ncbi:MAG: hypothetical protein ACRDWS_14525 [Acidimicrobiia bacterium]